MKDDRCLKSGDIVVVGGWPYKVTEVWSQDYYKGVWDVEFIDSQHCYHHWKSDEDGGKVIKVIPELEEEWEYA